MDFEYLHRESNWEADELAQIASGMKINEELTHKLIAIGKKNHPSIYERESDYKLLIQMQMLQETGELRLESI